MKKIPKEEKTIELLEKILRVLSLQVGADKSITERVNLLKSLGIDNKTIADVLGTSQASVRTLSSLSKKSKK
ncbi:MAG: hypothetical protein HYT22_04010 [Candidatus Niyogibacteria bacterium]|nr:hypothetical protein [Candidatus Niyogibacteria bacterium]